MNLDSYKVWIHTDILPNSVYGTGFKGLLFKKINIGLK